MAPDRAGECGGGCRRGKAAHASTGAMAGFFGCLLLVWAIGGCGRSSCSGVAEEQVVGQFNLSRSQLQELVCLLSSSERECMGKSGLIFDDRNQVNSMSCIPDALCLQDKTFDGKKNWLKDLILHEICAIQDKYDINSHAPALLKDEFLQNVMQQDISSPTTQYNFSGLTINFHKSELFCFGEARALEEQYTELFGCSTCDFPLRYLGIPIHYRKLRSTDWRWVEEWFEKRLNSWKGKFLSYGGHLMLINFVLSNLRMYMMSFFVLP